MKKVIFLAILGLLFAPLVPDAYSQKSDIYFDTCFHAPSNDFKGGLGYHAGIITPAKEQDIFGDYWISYYSEINNSSVLSKGTFGATGLNFGPLYIFPQNNYDYLFGFGWGYYIFNHDIEKALQDNLRSSGYKLAETIRNNSGFYIKLAARFDFNSNIKMNIGAKYITVNTIVDAELSNLLLGGTEKNSWDLHYTQLLLYVGCEF